MTSITRISALLAICLFFISSCGGGSSSSTPPPSTTPSASLTISLSGLPSGSSPDVMVTGPNSYSQTLTATTTLSTLESGTYTISINEVSSDGIIYDVLPAEQTITLGSNENASVTLIYQAEVVSTGVISNFGSVYVNGVRYATDNTEFNDDEQQEASEDDFDVGMVVTVNGRISADGTVADAVSVTYTVHAKGPVDSVSLTDNQVVVLGQTFEVDELTIFNNITFDTLQPGMIVAISGIDEGDTDGDGINEFLATHVNRFETVDTYVLNGEVSLLDTEAQQFSIFSTQVDYSAATVVGTLEDGVSVNVKSTSDLVNGILIADSVTVITEDTPISGQQIALDGVITSIVDEHTFIIADHTISWDEDTEFYAGTSDDLAVNLRVKAFGVIVDDVLQARAIRLDKQGVIQLEGAIEVIDTDAQTLTLLDTTFTLDQHSHFIDRSDAKVRRLTLGDLAIGDTVEVKAFNNDGELVIRLLARTELSGEESSGNVELEGQVGQISQPDFQVQGVMIVTNEFTEFEYLEDDLTADEFFALLTSGSRVSVEGQRQGDDTLLGLEVELLDDRDNTNQGATVRQVKIQGAISELDDDSNFVLNGRHVVTDEYTRFKDGTEADLQNGALVEVKGRELDTGDILATRVEFEREDNNEAVEIQGTIDTFTSATEFTVNGHAVTTIEDTIYVNGDVSSLAQGVVVEVKGILDNASTLIAHRIEFDSQDEEISISGTISNFVSETDFMVANQQVTTTQQTKYGKGNHRRLGNGVIVEIEGTLNAENILVAKEIEFSATERTTLEGEIQALQSSNSFTLANHEITFDEYTEFDNGTAEDLSVGVSVKVKGFFTSDNAIKAEEIEFEDSDDGDGDDDEGDEEEEEDGGNG